MGFGPQIPMPWGRLRGAAPGYPAAAARLFNSSCKIEETLTDSRPRDGRLVTLSGIGTLARKFRELPWRCPL
jgi:hypothetical protein